MLQSWTNGSALLWPPSERKQQVGECWVCVILFPRLIMHRGVTGVAVAPPVRVQGSALEKNFGPYFPVGESAHGFVHGFAHGFGA